MKFYKNPMQSQGPLIGIEHMPVQSFVSPATQTENQIEFHVSSLGNKLTEVMISVSVCMVCVTLLKKKWKRRLIHIASVYTNTQTYIFIYIYIYIYRERERERERIPSQPHDALPCTTWRTSKKRERLSLKKAMF